MSLQIRTFADLEKAEALSRERHRRMREERLGAISAAIEAAVDKGASEVEAILEALSDRERNDLLKYFPRLLVSLARAGSVDEMRTITRGARALAKFEETASEKRVLDATSADLARRAFAFAHVPLTERNRVVNSLKALEEAPSSAGALFLLWLRIRLGVLGRDIRRFFYRR